MQDTYQRSISALGRALIGTRPDLTLPNWARKEIARWRAGKRPPLPRNLSVADKELLALVAAVRDPAQRRKGESREQRIMRIAQKRAPAVRAFLGCRGGTYDRIVKDWAEWERAYLPPEDWTSPNNKKS